MHLQENSNYTHRPTAVIYMVAAGRSLVGQGALLHQLPTLDLPVAGIKVELMADDLGKVIHSADRLEQIGRIHYFDGALFRFLSGTSNQTLEGHTVQHEVVIVNMTVGTIARGEIASFALNANNLIQQFLALFPLGLFSSLPALLLLYFSVRFKAFRPLSRL